VSGPGGLGSKAPSSHGRWDVAGGCVPEPALLGLVNATLTGATINGGDHSLFVGGNYSLTACRVDELRQKFLTAGYPSERLIIETNGPACP
jgi:hypothetical protein